MADFNYTDSELKAMKSEYARSATQQQFDLWIAECRNRGLVPVKDVVLQVRATKEWNPDTKQKEFVKKTVHITTIQALRKLAERTGKYAGQLPSTWIYLDNASKRTESDIPLPEPGTNRPMIPWAAKASVLRKGFEHPITVPARFEAYAQYFSNDGQQSLNTTWANRGPEQLEKCAEALALRKAFPEELGGLFLQEELRDEETVAAVAQESTENVQPAAAPVLVPEKKARKKKESVPDAGLPWGGEFSHPKSGDNPEVTQNRVTAVPSAAVPEGTTNIPQGAPNIHGVVIEDSEIEFPGDDEKPAPVVQKADNRPATAEERKGFMDRLIKLKNAGYTGIREYLLKESGVQITNDIPVTRMNELVDKLEAAERGGTLKEVLK